MLRPTGVAHEKSATTNHRLLQQINSKKFIIVELKIKDYGEVISLSIALYYIFNFNYFDEIIFVSMFFYPLSNFVDCDILSFH